MASPHYTIINQCTTIELETYIRDYRDVKKFEVFCKDCRRYNACWSCPPFDFDMEEYIAPYTVAHIIGTKIIFQPELIAANTGANECCKISYQVIREVRGELDERLLQIEKQFFGSKAFFAGTCQICPDDTCKRKTGEPCIAPDQIRPSLEAFGFDMGKTTSKLLGIEMKWGRDGQLPEYFTLVSGLFSEEEILDVLSFLT